MLAFGSKSTDEKTKGERNYGDWGLTEQRFGVLRSQALSHASSLTCVDYLSTRADRRLIYLRRAASLATEYKYNLETNDRGKLVFRNIERDLLRHNLKVGPSRIRHFQLGFLKYTGLGRIVYGRPLREAASWTRLLSLHQNVQTLSQETDAPQC